MYAIKVSTDGWFSFLDVDFDNFDSIFDAVGSYFDIVRTSIYYEGKRVVFLCDGDGYAKELADNEFASYFYLGPTIRGDVVFCLEDGSDLKGFSNYIDILCELLNIAEELEVV